MGQVTNPSAPGIQVRPIDRESGPGAGAGASGNQSIFLGLNAGLNSTSNNLIVIGNGSGGGGIAAIDGSIIVGQGSLNALTTSSGAGLPIALIALGTNIAPAMTSADSTIMIGAGVLPLYQSSMSRSVWIGNAAGGNWNALATASDNNVVIGYNATTLSAPTGGGMAQCVIIGSQAMAGVLNVPVSSIVIGYLAGASSNAPASDIMIGTSCSTNGRSQLNTLIGTGVTLGTVDSIGNVVVGSNQTTLITGSFNTVLGTDANVSANPAGLRSISIGEHAGRTLPAGLSNILLIETNNIGDAQRAMLYGDMLKGNLVLGNSTDLVNRDFGGIAATNVIKLLNGSIGGVAPVGGGYFYVTGGFLHWVDSNGLDSQLSRTALGQLASQALSAYTNNAGVALGSLTNAPVAGNPSKWIPINDNGTIRNIPAW